MREFLRLTPDHHTDSMGTWCSWCDSSYSFDDDEYAEFKHQDCLKDELKRRLDMEGETWELDSNS